MAVAPLIKPITTQKGIFYTFQSGIEDMTLTFNNNTNKFKFSKFALLRIPEITVPNSIETDNPIQFLAQGETPILNGLSTDQNINLAKSFENYALNLESLLISQTSYQKEKKLNVSERVFWKWLKELGAIRWRDSNNTEVIQTLPTGQSRWSEAWSSEDQTTYNRVVKYIGDIDVVNSLRSNANTYSELYIHVPTSVGVTPTVLFNSVPDVNYGPGMVIVNTPKDPLDLDYLNNRHYSDTHPYPGMNLLAFYDLGPNAAIQKISDATLGTINWGSITTPYPGLAGQGTGFWWGPTEILHTYYTDQAEYFGQPYGTGVTSSEIKTQRIHKEYNNGTQYTVEYLRSTLDGVVIDFDIANYVLAASDSSIKTLAQMSEKYSNQDFEFNAVLVYYDVYDPNPTGTSGTEPTSATNLYGIYFLNEVQQSGSEYIIPTISKYKPNAINKTNGNAFSFKINLKFDTSIEDVAVEQSVNDYSTLSLEMFNGVLTQMRLLQTQYNDKLLKLEQLRADVDLAKDSLLNSTSISSLSKRIGVLETTVSASVDAFNEASSIMDLIDSVNTRIDEILSGTTSLQISYNTDSFKPGYGINLDKSVPNQITFFSNLQNYSDINITDMSTAFYGNVTLSLGLGGTQYRHLKLNGSGNQIPFTLTRNLNLYIDDSVQTWSKGQTIKIVFDSQIIIPSASGYQINIFTDSQNITNNPAAYSVRIATLTSLDFPSDYGRTGRTIIEIVCTNPKTLTFVVDKIIR